MKGRLFVALLFGLSGAVSYGELWLWQDRPVTLWLGGVPFGILAACLFARTLQAGSFLVILFGLVWAASVETAIFLIGDHAWNSYIGMALAGLVGGFGVAASTGISYRSLLSARSLVLVTITGGVLALPFGYWEQKNADLPSSHVLGIACFVLWQAAVGTFLFNLCTESSESQAVPLP